ncbi:unnamed protein product [Euphydryas editha]|uniref:Uncharacterized protein n=1 Tax=Euphydryas editha TaxID=104508 RepID=A0AAU9TR32_EUPED|nr:unnamed protein product [Euphydryas editha]
MLRILFFVLFLHESYGVIYHLNATEFERMPPVYKTDNYESCLQDRSDMFCELFFQLVSDEPNELLYMIEEYSEHSTTHFDHTKLRHGVCVTQRCQNYIENNTSVSETILEGCLNQTFWDDYRLKTRIQQYSCYNLASREIQINNSDIVAGFIVLTILVLNIVGSLYDVCCTSTNLKDNSIILSFSIKRHWRKLITTSRTDGRSDDIKSFNGIRLGSTSGSPDPDGPQNPRKRLVVDDLTTSNPSSKITIIHPSSAIPSIQTVYVHPSFSEAPKSYTDDDKGPFIDHVSKEVAINFGQFLHTHKIKLNVNDGVKNIGRNKISVEFSFAEADNSFTFNPILEMNKYKTTVPTYNITRMGIIKGIPVYWSIQELVKSLELLSGCRKVIKARRLNRKFITEGTIN